MPDQPEPHNPRPKPPTKWELATQSLPTVIYSAIAGALVLIIAWQLKGEGGFLQQLGNRDTARGLITFLIVLTTVIIALILTISTLISDVRTDDKRFDQGKQVLTALIGIVGTIVGFYYGAEATPKGGGTEGTTKAGQSATTNQAQGLSFGGQAARLSNPQPKKGESFTIEASIVGGKPPFTYAITFDGTIPNRTDQKAADRNIKQDFAIPATLSADKDVPFLIVVKDSDGKTFEYNKDGSHKIHAKAQ